MSVEYITQKGAQLVKKFGTRDPFKIAEGLGIKVMFVDDLKNLKGVYRVIKRNRWIFINSNLPERMQRIVCAHELGHMFLHKNSNALFMDTRTHFVKTKYENEANTFAAELLIPDSVILDNPGMTKNQIARIMGYEEKILDFKTI